MDVIIILLTVYKSDIYTLTSVLCLCYVMNKIKNSNESLSEVKINDPRCDQMSIGIDYLKKLNWN